MKNIYLTFSAVCIAIGMQAQVSKTINLSTAGKLSTLLTSTELTTITDLTLTGKIDARDFKTMRDAMTVLENIDLSETSIVGYTGSFGTYPYSVEYYNDDIPPYAFCTFSINEDLGKSSLKSIKLPSTITNITHPAFTNCTNLTSISIDASNTTYASIDGVIYNADKSKILLCPAGRTGDFVIPNSVERIEGKAFFSCRSLTSVTIPNSVTQIGIDAFSSCSGLTSVTIPNSVNIIRGGAFGNCSGLTSVTIPNTITTIELSTFSNCSSLKSITIPSSVTTIDTYAFSGCTALTSVTIPASVTTIGSAIFSNCKSLTAIEVDASNEYYTSDKGVLYNKDQTTLVEYPNGRAGSYIIANTTTKIMENAFNNCSVLVSIILPASLTTIENGAFYDCIGLTSIEARSTSPAVLSASNIFVNVPNTIPLYVPKGSADTYTAASTWNDFNITERNDNVLQLSDYKLDLLNSTTGNVNVTSNTAWAVASNQTWLTVSPASGSNNGALTLTATANTGAARTAIVTVTATGVPDQTFAVIQGETVQLSLSLSTSTASMLASMGTATVTVTSNAAWAAASDQTWLAVSPATGSNDGTITLTATANTGAARTATVTVSGTGITAQTLTVTQAAGNEMPVGITASNALVVYPNPTTESFTVNTDEMVTVEVYFGSQFLFSQTAAGNQSVSLADRASGEYIAVVKTAKKTYVHTIIKQ